MSDTANGKGSVLLTALGPVSDSSFDKALLNESALFDLTRPGINPVRLCLENRWEFVLNPTQFLDNLSGTLDMLDYELKHAGRDKTLICLHSNSLLLSGDKSLSDRMKAILAKYAERVTVILSVGQPATENALSDEQCIEYIASHVFYGKNGLHFGMIGPLVIDSTVSNQTINIFLKAHHRTGAPVLIHLEDFSLLHLVVNAGFRPGSTIIFGAKSQNDVLHAIAIYGNGDAYPMIGVSRRDISQREADLIAECVREYPRLALNISPGCRYKCDFKKYGGTGFASPAQACTDVVRRLAFPWSAPVVESRRDDESEKWVCDVCGLVSRLNEKENYTKLGFTYCSVACLSDHRKRGFPPTSR